MVAFIVVLVLSIAGSIWYMNVGRQWNTTATTIDDATGSLENYSVLVFDGMQPPSSEDEAAIEPRTRASVLAEYREKKADATTLDLVHPYLYSEGVILRTGEKRIGVFSVFSRAEASRFQNRVAAFEEEKVDFVVCITGDGSLLLGSEGLNGIDIVVCSSRPCEEFKANRNGAYVVESPCVGKIGAILVSPSNVVSSKVLGAN